MKFCHLGQSFILKIHSKKQSDWLKCVKQTSSRLQGHTPLSWFPEGHACHPLGVPRPWDSLCLLLLRLVDGIRVSTPYVEFCMASAVWPGLCVSLIKQIS